MLLRGWSFSPGPDLTGRVLDLEVTYPGTCVCTTWVSYIIIPYCLIRSEQVCEVRPPVMIGFCTV